MRGHASRLLPDGERLHLQHGPIDLIVRADGEGRQVRMRAYAAAEARFKDILGELVAELPRLRAQAGPDSASPAGPVGRRMLEAVSPYSGSAYVTPMAAVAGAVADEVLGCMRAATGMRKAFVNNGGDIAVHLDPGESYNVGLARTEGMQPGRIRIEAGCGIGGIATSGTGGRSLSMGIADSVTVMADSAASADAAATLIANAVDLPGSCAIARARARSIDPESDLGDRQVVVACGPLSEGEVDEALARGVKAAKLMLESGLIASAVLFLRGSMRLVGVPEERFEPGDRGFEKCRNC